MRFENLDLNDNVLDALYDMRFDSCTPIQEKTIPEILNGHDVLGVAQTGTGKTAAYLLPVLSKLDDGGYPEGAINCVVMSPTRELAQQIDQAMQGFGYYLQGVSSIAVYGGNDGNRYDQEVKSLKLGADVVIATPGRLISHISLGNVDLSKVSFFILDEADRMLDMGFADDIKAIAKELPQTCQTIMFSATMPEKIEDLAKTLLKNPIEIKLAVSKPAEKIKQSAYICYETQKLGIIKDIFKAGDLKRVIVFCGSKTKVKQVNSALQRKHINSGEMHSDLTQEERNDIMYKFKAGQLDVLVATDIVSRGIDIDDITMVINYDVPHDTEDYVHRIGRTARADRDGVAITLVSEEDQFYFQQTEKFLEKEIQKNKLPENLGDGPEYRKQGKPNKNNNSAKNRRRKDRNQTSHKDKKQHCHQKNNDITERTSNPQNKRTNPMYRDHQYEGKKTNENRRNKKSSEANKNKVRKEQYNPNQENTQNRNTNAQNRSSNYPKPKRKGNIEGNFKKRQNSIKDNKKQNYNAKQNKKVAPIQETTVTKKTERIKGFIKKLFGFRK
ncbi:MULTISPECIES: DEAD/DEAH box helicase [Segatella]|uniref:ATP-dependent RNA helicase, DEAD/DEAH box family n=2 Tax=Segatella TaxID=2974251 RepID=D8DY56_9BACT|nr:MULTISPECIES: DEAD/DEAH box helicase [Segatella]EFI71608.1 ATP-dependent RNA helicase, DEAD/DEAH box family [Segatella baroniae B14]MDR4930700.1 DEAD/DEAH box helicase [Segatella bryantii]OYP53524.1 ATP-dependent helicase [Segatella bryantii]UKK78442.1 DEAD/DEAH box helicase [Segatella baroniae B14]UKK81477.1 DEAD/DEAH box helicase [Segatella bryantii]